MKCFLPAKADETIQLKLQALYPGSSNNTWVVGKILRFNEKRIVVQAGDATGEIGLGNSWVSYPLGTEIWVTEEGLAEKKWDGDISIISQWVTQAPDFSSRYGKNSYCPTRVCGLPNVFPSYGDQIDSFVARTYGKPESIDFIELLYDIPVIITSVEIFETYCCGAISEIWGFDNGNVSGRLNEWVCLWKGPATPNLERRSRVFFPKLFDCNVCSQRIRLIMDARFAEYYPEIDAVRLNGTKCEKPRLIGVNHKTTTITTNDNNNINNQQSNELKEINSTLPVLPVDIMLFIFSFLSVKDLLVGVPYVCREWRTAWKQGVVPTFFTNVDFFPLWYESYHSHPQINSALSFVFPHISKLSFAWNYRLTSPASILSLFQFNEKFQLLEKYRSLLRDTNLVLQIKNTNNLPNHRTVQIDQPLISKMESLSLTRTSFQNIDEIVCRQFPNLTELDFSNCANINDNAVAIVSISCPNLKKLWLKRCGNLTNQALQWIAVGIGNVLEDISLYDIPSFNSDGLIFLFSSTPNLRILDLGMVEGLTDQVIEVITKKCQKLEEISLWFCRSLTSTSGLLLSTAPLVNTLRSLDVGWSGLGTTYLLTLIPNAKNLQRLYVTCNRNFSDQHFRALELNSIQLTHLDIMGNAELTFEGLVSFLKKTDSMRWMDVSFCGRIRENQYKLLRSQFPHIHFLFSTLG